jgi:hypothetical protein
MEQMLADDGQDTPQPSTAVVGLVPRVTDDTKTCAVLPLAWGSSADSPVFMHARLMACAIALSCSLLALSL